MRVLIFCLAALLSTFIACKKTDSTIENPYDKLNKDSVKVLLPEPSPTSLAGLHKNLFLKTCANSGCHDGTFEPDFRTAESSYNTLIGIFPTKTDALKPFTARVVPGKADESMLIHRMTVDVGGNSGIMPLVVNPNNSYKTDKDRLLQNLKDWINDGAKNLNGEAATNVNFPPQTLGVNVKIGSSIMNRGGKYEPILVPAESNITLFFSFSDDNTNQTAFTQMKIAASKNPADYTTATWSNLVSNAETLNGLNGNFLHAWSHNYSTSGLIKGEVIWFRLQGIDEGTVPFIIPNNNSMFFLKKYFAIKII